ncbi:MAG: HAMP domain-containing histidine kinase [Spirochaetales bacterium]|nr:HAMP domain-containing histidine kinase [Spirochaetales bacterium]
MTIRKRIRLSYIVLVTAPFFLFLSASFFVRDAYIAKLARLKLTVQTQEFNNQLYKFLGNNPDDLLIKENLETLINLTKYPENITAVVEVNQKFHAYAGYIDSNIAVHFIDQKFVNYWLFNLRDGTFAELYLIDRSAIKEIFPFAIFVPILVYMIFISILSYYTSITITVPLKKLKDAANSIKNEDFDIDLTYRGDDEFGSVFTAFNDMRVRLKHIVHQQLKYESNRAELMSNISHDLKTPITAIKGYIEGLKDGVANTPEKVERYHATIYKKVNLLDKLIENLFLYSKLDLKTLSFNFQKLNLNLFLKDIIDEVLFESSSLNIQLKSQGDIYIKGDPIQLQRVVHNLIGNSIKYNDKEVCNIDISLKIDGNSARASFSDNGIGVHQKNCNNIFERFYRSDPARSSCTEGSGLGLAISKQIIEEHKGSIYANSNLKEGLTVTFILPLWETVQDAENINS